MSLSEFILWAGIICAFFGAVTVLTRICGFNDRAQTRHPRAYPEYDRRPAADAAPRTRLACRHYDPPALWCANCRAGHSANCSDPM